MSDEVMVYLGQLQGGVDAALQKLDEQDFAARVWKKDPAAWKKDAPTQAKISNRLGWLEVAQFIQSKEGDLQALADTIKAEGYRHVVLLGMGGSSLGPEVLRQTFGRVEGSPELIVVDTTDPAVILETERKVDLAHTLFIVSSKSGTTTEPNTFMAYYYDKVKAVKGTEVGQSFIAITDPGSSLEKHGRDHNFREIFLNPPDIGGRYSVLSYFGMVPAALAGYDLHTLLDRAVGMAESCHKPGMDNPGLHLGAIMGAAALAGRDKTTILVSKEISSYGLWAEQLIAESTGKESRGIVPVAGETLGGSEVYSPDRLFVALSMANAKDVTMEAGLKRLEEAGHPVVRLYLSDLFDIAAEFFRWEFAIPVAGALIDINPFDEPNVTESKDNTKRLLGDFVSKGELPKPTLEQGASGLAAAFGQPGGSDMASALQEFFRAVRPGDYVAFMAYSPLTPENDAALQKMRTAVQARLKVATTVGYGPRFLHSTGQLHKGGAANGVFVQIITADLEDAPIPDEPYSFSILKQAQALGDFESLRSHGRRVVSLQPQAQGQDLGLGRVAEAIKEALS